MPGLEKFVSGHQEQVINIFAAACSRQNIATYLPAGWK